MGLHDLLKQMKEIRPDAEYARRSRHLVLSSKTDAPQPVSVRQFFFQIAQMGPALALAVVLLLLIAGGVSTSNYFSPITLSSLDPVSLRAEADAIDIQIQLMNIGYAEPQNAETTSTVANSIKINIKNQVTQIAKTLGIVSSTPTSPLTIDEALSKLAE